MPKKNKKVKIVKLNVDDKHYSKDERLKIYTNQCEMALKINEIVDRLNNL